MSGRVFAIDASEDSPACHIADASFLVPPLSDPDYLPTVLDICRAEGIRLLVPTIDTELELYASTKCDFTDMGATVGISSPESVAITHDKEATHSWLVSNGFPTVRQLALVDFQQNLKALPYPIVIKPRAGSMSNGVLTISSEGDLPTSFDPTAIIQTFAPGDEYTISVLVDRSGRCVAAVPRLRLVTRGGEVSTGRTVRDPGLEDLATRIAERLPGAYGPLNIQVIKDESTGQMNVIEINARFGGGDPLAWAAGADFPRWMIEELADLPRTASNDWIDGVSMVRFDRAVYTIPGGDKFVG